MRQVDTTLGVGGSAAFTQILRFDSHVDGNPGTSPRVLQVGSLNARAFDLFLDWTGSGGVSAKALLSVPTGTQVCVFASSITVSARNLDTVNTNNIVAIIADGCISTSNVYQVWMPSAPSAQVLEIPAWARSVSLQANNTSATGNLTFKTAAGTVMAIVPLGSIPSDGALIAGASTIEVTCDHPCRVVYHLTL